MSESSLVKRMFISKYNKVGIWVAERRKTLVKVLGNVRKTLNMALDIK